MSTEYIVQSGDTLEGVALKTGVRVSLLKSINSLYSSSLYEGQKLVLKGTYTRSRGSSISSNNNIGNNNTTPTTDTTMGKIQIERETSSDFGDFHSAAPISPKFASFAPPLSYNPFDIFDSPPSFIPATTTPSHHIHQQNNQHPPTILEEDPTSPASILSGSSSQAVPRRHSYGGHQSSSEDLPNMFHDVVSSPNLVGMTAPPPQRHNTLHDEDLHAGASNADWIIPAVVNWFHSTGDEYFGSDHPDKAASDAAYATAQAKIQIAEEMNNSNDHTLAADWETLLNPPTMMNTSNILDSTQATQLRLHFPIIVQYDAWYLLYSVLSDGADIVSFYNLIHGAQYTLMVVQTSENEIFGGFASSPWDLSKDFYGSGECFVFKFEPNGQLLKYRWTQENDFYQFSNHEKVGMGGGGDGFAFVLDGDFISGGSYHSKTFNNEILTRHKDDSTFRVKNVEIWSFESCINFKHYIPRQNSLFKSRKTL